MILVVMLWYSAEVGKPFSQRVALTIQGLTEGECLKSCNSCLQYNCLKSCMHYIHGSFKCWRATQNSLVSCMWPAGRSLPTPGVVDSTAAFIYNGCGFQYLLAGY